jgi:hypothetical protein
MVLAAVLAIMLGMMCAVASATADGLSIQDPLFANLTRPLQSLVDGRSFRDAVHSIADEAQINLWIDREIDPTATVTLGPLGPTPIVALQKLAQTRDGVVMPVAGVLLIGRQRWVDQTAKSVFTLDLSPSLPADEVRWDDLTTPREALEIAADSAVRVVPSLPHDLWPATRWRQIDRRVAVTLILAQFDRRPLPTDHWHDLQTERAVSSGPVTARYSLGKSTPIFRGEFLRADRGATVDAEQSSLVARGTIAAHRLAIEAVLISIRPAQNEADRATYTVKQLRTTAATAFAKLAEMSGRKCQIEAEAEANCAQLVSFAGDNLTLRELSDQIAAQVGVSVQWSADTIVISRTTVTVE